MVSNDLLCVVFILSLIQTIFIIANEEEAAKEYNISQVAPILILGITTLIIFVNGFAIVATGGTIWN